MKSVIQKLYDAYMDNGADNEMSQIHDDVLCKEKKDEAYQRYQELRNRLTDELAEELDILMDKYLEIYPQELENSFAMGFKTGAKLMCEIFAEETKKL